MLRECIQTVEEVNGDMDEGQPRFITTILTCEGDLQDPGFPHRLESLVGKLNRLISEEKEPFCVEKVEPWNSVRVTFTIPWEAALRLRQLAQQGDQVLRDLGILSVQIEGDQVITLTLANRYSEPQEFVFKTSANADSSSEVPGQSLGFPEGNDSASKTLGQLLSKAIKPSSNTEVASRALTSSSHAPEENTVNGNVAFQFPNVVAPSSQSPPPFKTNAAALMSKKSYTQNPVSSGPFPFASMTYAMNTKHAAANSQSTKHIQGCSSRFPFTPPLQRSASSAWMPYVSQKAVVTSSSTNIPSKTSVSQPNLLSASQHQNQYVNVTVSNANFNSASEVEETVVPQATKANNVLSSPLLVNLLQTETSSKFPHPTVSPVSSPVLQPPAKRKRKPRKPKEANIISGRTSRSDVINCHTVSLPSSTNATLVSQNSSISKIQSLGKTLSPYFATSSLEEQAVVSNKSQSPLRKENSVLPNGVPFQSFPNSDFTVRSFQTVPNSLHDGASVVYTSASSATDHDGASVVYTSASSAMDQPMKNSSPANNESKKISTDATVNNCTPFPSPPPSADGKVKHLINPFTGHLEPMPSDDEEDDECIGSLSLFPELEMMDTNDGAESDKNVGDRSEDKQSLQKVPVSECGSQINTEVQHPVKKDAIDALMCRKPDVYTVSSCASSISERNYSFARAKNVNPSEALKSLGSIQTLGVLPKELKKSILHKDVHTAVENPRVSAALPVTSSSNSPLPAQVSQVDLSFLQPHLQNWKAAPNKGKNASIIYNSYIKPRVAENFITISKSVRMKHQENGGKVENPNVVVERPKYSYSSLSSSKTITAASEILKGSHVISDSLYALRTRTSEHDSKIHEFSVNPEKSGSNVNTVNLPVKDLPNTAFTRPPVFFNKLTVLDIHNIDKANSTLKQVYHVNTSSPKSVSFRKVQVDDKTLYHSRLGFPQVGHGNVETYEKGSLCVTKADEINVGVSQSVESLVKNPVVHEANSKLSTQLNLETYSSAASYNTSSPNVVVSLCDKSAVMSSQVNSSLFHPSPDSSDIKEFKQSPLERHVVSPESNPHFETPPDSRSPISSISSNDRLPVETVSSFDVIRKETLFNPAKHDRFLAEMMESTVEIRRHKENSSEQCSMSSLITPSTTVKREISMHRRSSENIPLCETSDSNKAIFSINSSLGNTTYSGSEKISVGETEHSSKELRAVLGERKSDQDQRCSALFPAQDQSKSLESNHPVQRRNSSVNCSSSSYELKRSSSGGSEVSHSGISFQSCGGTSLSVSAGYRRHDSVDDSTRKSQQEGHFASGSVSKSSKTYDFMDNNISKPPEQLPLEIFENSESESQSPASSFDGESSAYFAGKSKHSVNVPSSLCGPIESHLSSQDHFSNTAPSDSSEKDVSVSSHSFVSHEVLSFGTCQGPLRNILLESNLTVSSPSELSGKCSTSQATSDRLVNNSLNCVVSNVGDVYAGRSVTTTSVANVPSSVSLSVPTVSKALPKSTCESSRKFANGSAFKSFHVEVSRSKNVDELAALDESFRSSRLEKSASLRSEASVAHSEMNSTAAAVNYNKSKELMNSFSAKVRDTSAHEELQSSSELNFSLRDNYPILTSAEYGKAEKFSVDFAEAGANGYTDHLFAGDSSYDNGLNLNISEGEDSKLLLSRSREIDTFPNYNALAQKFISSVDDKLVSEIKCKLNISRDLKLNNKISAVDASFSSNLQHNKQYENNNCVTIVSAEELHTASKKSNRSYSEDSFGDSSVESPYRNSDPLELEYNICDCKFDSVDRSLRPKHRNGSTCLIEDEANSPSDISGSLLFTSASDISGPNAKMVFQSTHEKIKTLNGRKDVNAACAIVEIRNASLFDGTKLLNPRKTCILSSRIGGEEQLQGIKRRRLSADSLR